MKKRVLALVMMMSLALVFAGCSKEEEGAAESTQTEEAADAAQEADESEAVQIASKVVKLGNYKGVEVAASDLEVTDEEVEEEKSYLMEDDSYLQEVEGRTVIEEGDIVNIDYRGLLDGEAFDGGTAQGYNLEIGSGTFIDGFEDQLIGKELGGSYDLDLKFPDEYQSEELAGQAVVFEVTVNKIQARVLPDDDEIKQMIRDSKMVYYVMNAITADTEFEMDAAEVESMTDMLYSQYEMMAGMYGMDMATYLSYFGMEEETFLVQCEEQANYYLQNTLIINEVAKAEGLATEAEIQAGVLEDGSDLYDVTAEFLRGQAVEK